MRCGGRIASGAWLCLALAVFGGGILLVFFRTARHTTHRGAGGVSFGVPQRSLKLLSLNVHHEALLSQRTATYVNQIDPDFLFLQEVPGKQIPAIRRQLGGGFAFAAFYPLQNLPDGGVEIGNAILAKAVLEDPRPIPNHMSGAAGVWASAVVDGRRFYVACLRLSDGQDGEDELGHFVRAWESLHGPPIVAAVDAGSIGSLQAAPLRSPDDDAWLVSRQWSPGGSRRDEAVHSLTVGPAAPPSR